MTDYTRVCDSCMDGGDCETPYEALDGTVYMCLNFRRRASDKALGEAS